MVTLPHEDTQRFILEMAGRDIKKGPDPWVYGAKLQGPLMFLASQGILGWGCGYWLFR